MRRLETGDCDTHNRPPACPPRATAHHQTARKHEQAGGVLLEAASLLHEVVGHVIAELFKRIEAKIAVVGLIIASTPLTLTLTLTGVFLAQLIRYSNIEHRSY